MTPYEEREARDEKLIKDLEKQVREASLTVGEEKVKVTTEDGYLVVRMKRANGTVQASKMHKVPECFRN